MKKLINLTLFLLIFTSCSSNRYLLNDADISDKNYLIKEIENAKAQGKILSDKPLVVIDGKPFRYNHELKAMSLNLSKHDIKDLTILNQDVGEQLYGDYAKDGVFIITTKQDDLSERFDNSSLQYADNATILFIVDSRERDKNYVYNLDPVTINTITVYKDKSIIKRYTDKDYDGVIIIDLKK